MNRLAAFRGKLYSVLRRIHGRAIGRSAARHSLVGRPDLWEMKRNFQIEFLRAHGLHPHHRLIDIGCGTLRGGIPIIRYLDAGRYIGVEARELAIREAHRELEELGLAGKRPILVHSRDFSTISVEEPVDFAWAFSVLIHFDDHVLAGCLAAVSKWLRPNGSFFANVNIGVNSTQSWDRFPVVTRTMDFYRSQAHRHALDVQDLGELRRLGHNSGIARHDGQHMLQFRCRRSS